MRIPIASKNDPMVLALTVQAKKPMNLRIRVADAYKPNTFYTDREGTVNGVKTFYIRMPRTSYTTVADVFAINSSPLANNPDLVLVKKEILDLPTFPQTFDSKSDLVKSALGFIQHFSEMAGIYTASMPGQPKNEGSIYGSNCNRFRIDYVDVIYDLEKTIPLSPSQPDKMVPNPNYGKELTTPARIDQERGIIQVSKKYFLAYAVPFRVAILLHEVSHFYFNNDADDEEEADLNALKIFLGSGYGFIDAENAFINVFDNADTPQNRQRYEKLNAYIMDFEARYNKFK